jgi:excisionase family DNA binding protein
MTPEQVADRWGCKPATILRLIKTGELPAFYVGMGKLARVKPEDVEAYEQRNPATEQGPCDVYVVRCQNFVKIGKATNVESRIKSLQAANPLELEVLKVLTEGNGHQLELELHKRFAAQRHRLEWFRIEGELAAWIEQGCPL